MPFPSHERELLLKVKGVGPTVLQRLEQAGITSLQSLAEADAGEVVTWISQELGSTCWRNSPQARAAISSAITAARAHVSEGHD